MRSFTFNDNINETVGKAMKDWKGNERCWPSPKLQCFLARSSLITIYKSFIRPHLDYEDVLFDQTSNATFSSKIELIQYTALAITGAIRDSSREKLYQELGLEYLHDRRWMRRLCLFCKVLLNKVPKYIYELISPFRHSFRNPNSFTSFACRISTLRMPFSRV